MSKRDDWDMILDCWRSGQIEAPQMFRQMTEDREFGLYVLSHMRNDCPPLASDGRIPPQ